MTLPIDPLACNRVMLVHFDGYSAALFFARWDKTLLAPAGLPDTATVMPSPAKADPAHSDAAVRDAIVERLKLNPDELVTVEGFHHWFQTDEGPVRVHLLRFDTFEPPKALIERQGGVFKPISELRASPKQELGLAREVFNLIIGAGG